MNYILFVLGIGMVIAGGVFGYFCDKAAILNFYLFSAIICFFFSFLVKFKKIKGWGFEAELWEKVQEDAEELVKHLKILTISTTTPIIDICSQLGLLSSGFSNEQLFKVLMKIEDSLKDNGISREDIEIIKHPFYFRVILQYVNKIKPDYIEKLREKKKIAEDSLDNKYGKVVKNLEEYNKDQVAIDNFSNWEINFKNFQVFNDINLFSTFEVLRDLIDRCDALDKIEKKEIAKHNSNWLENLKYFCENKRFFDNQSRNDWFSLQSE